MMHEPFREGPRLAALSVDLDEAHCYAAIHGLGAPPTESRHAIYEHALPRFQRFFEDEGVCATFFVVGRDAEHPANARLLRALAEAGHELGNHSWRHPYELTRLSGVDRAEEIDRGAAYIEAATGFTPRGFRAPGYTVDDELLGMLQERGYRYDSSVFPCPAYYGAKAVVMGWMRLRGRRSRSVLDDPRVLSAPADPYRVGRPYWQRGGGLLELPIGVTRDRNGRLPYIGTSVVLASVAGARWLTRCIVGRPLVNLELHGIDLADADRDGLQWLRPHQPDLRRPLRAKMSALREAVRTLRAAGYSFVTLSEAAEAFSAAPS